MEGRMQLGRGANSKWIATVLLYFEIEVSFCRSLSLSLSLSLSFSSFSPPSLCVEPVGLRSAQLDPEL